MSGKILFSHGDLLEYTRPVAGDPEFDRPITVRAIVLGFAVSRNDQTGDIETRVWCYEGAEQLGSWEDEGDWQVMEGRIDKEKELVIWTARNLLSFDNFQVVETGNHPTHLDNFEVGR